MLSRGLSFALRFAPRASTVQITTKNGYSAASGIVYDRDPAPYFFSEEVQTLLKTITRPVPEKVFRRRLDGRPLEPPQYKFMTDEQLEKAKAKADKYMWELLQMPPVVKVREEDENILSNDPELQGFDKAKWVFTDITFGVRNKDRMVVVRDTDGVLRHATNAQKDRLNQMYFPMKDRDIRMPRMFESEHLQPVLDRQDYEFILDRACVQFEPDSEDYHRVTSVTYETVNENMHHDKLRSTRHYGTMVFYLAWTKNIDNLVLENIMTDRVEDAALVIKLYHKLSEKETKEKDHVKLIQHFIQTEAKSKRKLDQALKTYLELESERRKLKENVEKAHGKTSSDNEEIKT